MILVVSNHGILLFAGNQKLRSKILAVAIGQAATVSDCDTMPHRRLFSTPLSLTENGQITITLKRCSHLAMTVPR